MCAVIETYEDRSIFDEKKQNGIGCSNKYKLIKTICEEDPSFTIENLKKKTEVELVDMVYQRHTQNPFVATEHNLNQKNELILRYKTNYHNHNQAISHNSQKEFSKLFENFQKQSTSKYQNNFSKEYGLWQENKKY